MIQLNVNSKQTYAKPESISNNYNFNVMHFYDHTHTLTHTEELLKR